VVCWGAVRDGALHLFEAVNTLEDLFRKCDIDARRPIESVAVLSLGAVELLPPVIPRRNVFCVGWNYQSHFDEGADKAARAVKEIPAHPAFFSKTTTTINSPHAPVPLHGPVTRRLDWEVELAVVIGKGGTSIAEVNALDHVFGYCVANDVSARDVQSRHGGQWFKGKNLDGTCPLGPVVVTRDEIPDPQALDIVCRVNGIVKQRSNTRFQVYPVARLIAEVSEGLTLRPGDVILTGTPAGVGFARDPPERLVDGDLLESEIVGIGILRNPISASVRHGRPQELGLV
jgi:2-keto-4-pentenoate hydratase/2-oxohepta-3-ene-1,7-dioic acid hydratase in catechol pathway